jgi:hypothetical protein
MVLWASHLMEDQEGNHVGTIRSVGASSIEWLSEEKTGSVIDEQLFQCWPFSLSLVWAIFTFSAFLFS